MRHVPARIARLTVLALPVLLAWSVAAEAQPNPTPSPNPAWQCAGRIGGGVRNYTQDALKVLADCEVDRIKGDICTAIDLQNQLSTVNDDLRQEILACKPEGLIFLCPLEGDIPAEVDTALTGPSVNSFRGKLASLVADLFTTPQEGCTRPTGAVSSQTEECAAEISDVIGGESRAEALEACFFSCERDRILTPSLELCVDDVIGDPVKQQIIECKADKLETLDTLEDRCSNSTLTQLGCPLGADSVSELRTKLEERLATLVQEVNLGIFHSDCRGTLPGEPTTPVPADVTLEPGMIKKKLACGQTIDSAFMEGNKTVSFDSDLNCGPSQTATDGVIVAKSNVIVSGRVGKLWSIRGPQRSSLRTGTGIKLLPGVTRVQIRNFKAIENFGIGISDADDGKNKKLTIVKSTVRRNIVSGLRIRSPRAVIEQVTADKNGIGMDLSGDGIKVKGSEAKGSLYPPKIGIQLAGTDNNLSGSVVVVSPLNTIELNGGAGIHVVAGAHLINQNQIRNNVGDGIVIDPLMAGSQVRQNTLKFNANGIVVNGDANIIDGNTCEENVGDGYVIAGTGNTVMGNGSGVKTDRGNGGAGYRVTGPSNVLETNEAEANVGSGFVITGTPTTLSDNTAQENFGHGFDIQSAGNTADGNTAEANNQAENDDFHQWTFVDGQIDGGGNTAGGDAIALPATAGFCDNEDDCPLDD